MSFNQIFALTNYEVEIGHRLSVLIPDILGLCKQLIQSLLMILALPEVEWQVPQAVTHQCS